MTKRETSGSSKTRVFIVDDHPVVRQGLAQMIGQQADFTVCGEAADVSTALKMIQELTPDMAVVDLNLKDSSGLDLIRDLKVRLPNLPVLVLSMYDESFYGERAIRAGARGYLMKTEAPEKVILALQRIRGGGIYLSDSISQAILGRLSALSANKSAPIECLTDRELEVFRLIGEGLRPRDIANRLHLSVKTIETYREHLKAKLNLATAGDLLQYAIRWAQAQES